jgi:hypothetical protein
MSFLAGRICDPFNRAIPPLRILCARFKREILIAIAGVLLIPSPIESPMKRTFVRIGHGLRAARLAYRDLLGRRHDFTFAINALCSFIGGAIGAGV